MKTKRILTRSMLLSAAMLALQIQAAPINPETQPLGYIGAIELNTTDLSNGGKAYRGWFENGNWQGDLIEYDASNAGVLTTSIDLTGTSPAQSPGGTNWSAHVQFKANAATISHWDTGRKIITNKKSNEILFKNVQQIPFRWLDLSPDQQNLVDTVSHNSSSSNSVVLNFIRGDRTYEKPSGTLRLRQSVLGDIVHSNPEYVGIPDGDSSETSYVNFKNANLTRAPRVYVGANDGMLHAFDALTGNEVWAYVPSMVYPKLTRLASPSYKHAYFVDGAISVKDAFVGGQWRTILVGSLGAGGKGLFVLDVTNPNLTSEVTGDTKLLGELTPGIKDVGYIFDASTITQLNDGDWYAVAGNGISSENGVAKLFLINLDNGKLETISTGSGGDNGLSAPALVDTDGDGKADIAYAGDIKGNMWKFDLTGNTPASWNLDYKLYAGDPSQPITMAPDVTNHPQIGYLVMFGTGKLYETADITDTSVQAMYGIWDDGNKPNGSESRLARLMYTDVIYTSANGAYTENVRNFRTVNDLDYKTYKGWKVELPAGERVLTRSQLRAGRLKVTATNPDGYSNWFHEATYDQGGPEDEAIFDLNRDGLLNVFDRARGNNDNDLDDPQDIPMAWQRPNGNMSEVTIASLGAGIDTLFLNFLNPPLIPGPTEGCVGNCADGLLGGHMDVDSDSGAATKVPGNDNLGGKTDAHQHEYDDEHNVTYVDYFNIDPTNVGKPLPVDHPDVNIDGDEKFIVLVANADMSSGASLTLNDVTYHAVEYQRIIHRALGNWDGSSDLKDPDGNSLIFTLNQIKANGGTLRTSMGSLAIISGGLIPTNTKCVKDENRNTNDRWRNGALTVQLVKASHFAGLGATESALQRIYVQNPPDLKTPVILFDGSQVELLEELTSDTTFANNVSTGTGRPKFEIMGGLRLREGTDDADFLWSTTLFWHWDNKDICYGDSAWEQKFIETISAPSEARFQEMLENAGFATWEDLVTKWETLACEPGDDQCEKNNKKEKESLESLFFTGLLVHGVPEGMQGDPSSGPGDGGGGSLSGDPVVIEGGVSEGGITSGPNFDLGRRTWIDIMPE